jgi:glycerol-3-phosphate O-acyltransferase
MSEERKIFDHVIPDIEDWPIYQLSEDRRKFIQEIDEFTLCRLQQNYSNAQLSDLIAKTIYKERIRIKEEPWKVDPPNERLFWRRIRKKLVGESLDRDEQESAKINREILQKIIHRYSEEIVGTFRIQAFLFARHFLTFFFNRLLNTSLSPRFWRPKEGQRRLQDRLIVKGKIEEVRSLIKKEPSSSFQPTSATLTRF